MENGAVGGLDPFGLPRALRKVQDEAQGRGEGAWLRLVAPAHAGADVNGGGAAVLDESPCGVGGGHALPDDAVAGVEAEKIKALDKVAEGPERPAEIRIPAAGLRAGVGEGPVLMTDGEGVVEV